jgi:Aerobic-type carbon monoxide dehydrogenase, large subunit CoxL/CutL homologs
MTVQLQRKYIGAPMKRNEDVRLITGRGLYVGDVALPGTLYASVLRSTFAHARIRRIDVSAAERLEGVVGVITAEMLGELNGPSATKRLTASSIPDKLQDALRAGEGQGQVRR